MPKFATADRIAEARSWAKRVGRRHMMKSVYSTLFLGLMKLRNFLRLVKNDADGRCLGGYEYTVLSDA